MKKNLFFMLTAVVAVLFSACSKDDDPGTTTQPAQLTIKLADVVDPTSRALETPGETTDGTILLNNGHIFVLNPLGAVTYSEALDVDAASGSTGQVLAQDVPSDSRVYVIGNIPTGSNVATLTTLTNIKAAEALMSTQTNYRAAALANDGGNPVQITIDTQTFDNSTATVEASVTIIINPLISRLELNQVTGDDKILAFTVAGVYVDDWYPSFTFGGSYAGTMYSQGTRTDFTGNTMKDEASWPATSATPDTPPFIAKPPVAGQVQQIWAYNVAAESLPRLIIKLTGVKYLYDNDANPATPEVEKEEPNPLYLTVTGYSGVTAFERGKIYNVGAIAAKGITFSMDKTSLTPNPVNVTLSVEVDIKEWVVVNPDAIL